MSNIASSSVLSPPISAVSHAADVLMPGTSSGSTKNKQVAQSVFERFLLSTQHPMGVMYPSDMDDVARLVMCDPIIWRQFAYWAVYTHISEKTKSSLAGSSVVQYLGKAMLITRDWYSGDPICRPFFEEMDRNKGNNWFSKLIVEVETKICDVKHKRGEKVVRTYDSWRHCNA